MWARYVAGSTAGVPTYVRGPREPALLMKMTRSYVTADVKLALVASRNKRSAVAWHRKGVGNAGRWCECRCGGGVGWGEVGGTKHYLDGRQVAEVGRVDVKRRQRARHPRRLDHGLGLAQQ